MRRGVPVFLAVLVAAVALAANDSKPDQGWDRLTTLVGTWEGTSTGTDHPGKVTLTYRLVSNGSTLMETMDAPEHSEAMITMYAPDAPNGRIVATHYCAAGNQPR